MHDKKFITSFQLDEKFIVLFPSTSYIAYFMCDLSLVTKKECFIYFHFSNGNFIVPFGFQLLLAKLGMRKCNQFCYSVKSFENEALLSHCVLRVHKTSFIKGK